MNADEIIEWANADLEDWEECRWHSMIPVPSINTAPLGVVIHDRSTKLNIEWRFRRMPRDPLLRAIVEAQNPKTLSILAVSDQGLGNSS